MKNSIATIIIQITLVCSLFSIAITDAVILLPSQDAFYRPEVAAFENSTSGDILKSRLLDRDSVVSLSFSVNLKNTYQFLYHTLDSLGQPTAAVTTLLEPHNADPSKLVSYQVPIDSASSDCAPSYSLQQAHYINATNIVNMFSLLPLDPLLIDALLSKGFYVVIPDYEGPQAMFIVKEMNAHAVLDSIRAVLSSGHFHSNAAVQLWGYSGGAYSSGAAIEVMSTYAPELNIIGTVAVGIAGILDYDATYRGLNGGFFSGVVPALLIGLSRQYAWFASYLDQHLWFFKRRTFYNLANLCVRNLVLNTAFRPLTTYVYQAEQALRIPAVVELLQQNMVGTSDHAPTVPMLIYHAAHDDNFPLDLALTLYNKWCSKGTPIQLKKDETSDHLTLQAASATHAMRFILDNFNKIDNNTATGPTVTDQCTIHTIVSTALGSDDMMTLGKVAFERLVGMLGHH